MKRKPGRGIAKGAGATRRQHARSPRGEVYNDPIPTLAEVRQERDGRPEDAASDRDPSLRAMRAERDPWIGAASERQERRPW